MFNLCTGYCFLLNVANCHILFYLSFTQHRNFIFIYFFFFKSGSYLEKGSVSHMSIALTITTITGTHAVVSVPL